MMKKNNRRSGADSKKLAVRIVALSLAALMVLSGLLSVIMYLVQ